MKVSASGFSVQVRRGWIDYGTTPGDRLGLGLIGV